MIEDAKEYKFDLIFTKSVSIFARNKLTALQYAIELKSLRIYVYFETQKTSNKDKKTKIFLTLYFTMVQGKTKAVSDNIKLDIISRMKQGVVFKYI